MNHRKPLIFRQKPRFGLNLLALGSCFLMAGQQSVQASQTNNCSDVYTPLSNFVSQNAEANKSAYQAASAETGVPWEMLAAIHYRETSFSRSNPNNGQGIFQFVNGDGGPYPPGPVSEAEFTRQLKFMANKLQDDYVWRGSVPRERRRLRSDESNITIVKDTLFSYNGRAEAYAQQAERLGYNRTSQPFEGSPYVMNRFDCARARMGIITRDYSSGIDGQDTRYGAFTVYARLKGDDYWRTLSRGWSWQLLEQASFADAGYSKPLGTELLGRGQKLYLLIKARNIGYETWQRDGNNPLRLATSGPDNRASEFADASWLAADRAAQLQEVSVAPGDIGSFKFIVQAPEQLGQYKEYFNLVAEGKSWLNDIGLYYPMSVAADKYQTAYINQHLYADSERSREISGSPLSPNTNYYLRLRLKNTGNTTWRQSNLNLGTAKPLDRNSNVAHNWRSANRAATLLETEVPPGYSGTFEFSIKTPSNYGDHREYFRPVAEGVSWLNDLGIFYQLNVKPPSWQAQPVEQTAFSNSSKTTVSDTNAVVGGSRLYLVVKLKNTGNTTWSRDAPPVRLATTSPQDRQSQLYDSTWLSSNRLASLQQTSVAPGSVGSFEFWLNVPYLVDGSELKENFGLVAESNAWMEQLPVSLRIVTQSPDYTWQYISQGIYTDATRTTALSANSRPTTAYYLRLKLRNTGGQTWRQGVLNLGTANPLDRSSAFFDQSWPAPNRAASLQEVSVHPGEIGTIDLVVKTPSTSGSYKEYFQPVAEGINWLEDKGLHWSFSVSPD